MKKYIIQLFLLVCLLSSCESNSNNSQVKNSFDTSQEIKHNIDKESNNSIAWNALLVAWIALFVALAPHIKKLATNYWGHNGGKIQKKGGQIDSNNDGKPDSASIRKNEANKANENRRLTEPLKNENKEEDLSDVQSPNQPDSPNTPCENIIMYAGSSESEDLFIEKQNCPGKTIYRLMLESENSTDATIELCLNEDATMRKVRARYTDSSFRGKIFELDQLDQNSEEDLKVLEPGRAIKIGDNTWRVTKPIKLGVRSR